MKRLFLPLILSLITPIIIGATYFRRVFDNALKGKDIKNYTRRLPLGFVRGALLDRKGRPMTSPEISWKVIQFNLRKETERRDLEALRALLGKDFKVRRYRYLGYSDILGLSDSEIYDVMRLKARFRSLEVVPKVRHKLLCKECFHTVGRATADGEGMFGLEKVYNDYLKGELGHVLLSVDAYGNLIDEPKVLIYTNPRDLRTYLDLDLYRLADSLMKPYRRGAIFAFNPKTGETYLVYSKPGPYDSTGAGDAPLLNRAVAGLYPPGSTFKPLVALLALKYGVIDTTFGVGCRGAIRFGRRTFRCWSVHGYTRLEKAIAQSCNVFFYNVGSRFGPKRFVEAVHSTGLFGRRLTLLPEEVPSRFPKRARYYGSVLNYAIGQGEILVTPAFLAVEAGLIGNGGWVVLPRFSSLDRPETLRIEAPEWAYRKVREGMLGVVEYGTASLSRIPGFQFGGKTGTAQNPHGEDHSLFIAFAPYDSPTFAIAVVVENAGHGGSAAAPIASMIISRWFGLGEVPLYYRWLAPQPPSTDSSESFWDDFFEELDL
ncbi:MAG: hypothetical protein GXO29_07375 [Thermotogae bacterium]|nr:hypothetical protein [Thermotogota bacterium]